MLLIVQYLVSANAQQFMTARAVRLMVRTPYNQNFFYSHVLWLAEIVDNRYFVVVFC